MSAAAIVEKLLVTLPEEDRMRIAERVFVEAGIGSVLPAVYPLDMALPAVEVSAMEAVGLHASPQTRELAEAARGRYASSFMDLFHNADTPTELARKLKLDPSRIRQRIRDRTLLAIELNGEKRVPRFQFDKGTIEVPGLAKVLALVDRGVSPLAFAMWFLTPSPDLALGEDEEPMAPREWLLRTGDIPPVLVLAKNL